MKKDDQQILYTVLGIAIIVALFFYLKKAFSKAGGGAGAGSTGSGILPSFKLVEKEAGDIAHKISEAFHKVPGLIGLVDPDTISGYVDKLTAIDIAAAKNIGKFADPSLSVSLPLTAITQLSDDKFKAVIQGWKKRCNYASIKQSNIWKASDRNPETADFLNRALKFN